MKTLALNTNTIDKFFGFLFHLDTSSKKKLIIRLTESIQSEKKIKSADWKNLCGVWVDTRDADQIINDIENSRVNNTQIEDL